MIQLQKLLNARDEDGWVTDGRRRRARKSCILSHLVKFFLNAHSRLHFYFQFSIGVFWEHLKEIELALPSQCLGGLAIEFRGRKFLSRQ